MSRQRGMAQSCESAAESGTKHHIELRGEDGPLLGVLYLAPLRLEVKRNGRYFEIDLQRILDTGDAIVVERMPKPAAGS